jgi:hypothetical protein
MVMTTYRRNIEYLTNVVKVRVRKRLPMESMGVG